jgi:hypothetical protein
MKIYEIVIPVSGPSFDENGLGEWSGELTKRVSKEFAEILTMEGSTMTLTVEIGSGDGSWDVIMVEVDGVFVNAEDSTPDDVGIFVEIHMTKASFKADSKSVARWAYENSWEVSDGEIDESKSKGD